MMLHYTPDEQNILRTFHSLATEARQALQQAKDGGGELRVVDGYLESTNALEGYRALCRPVRRAYLERDRVSFLRVCEILRRGDPAGVGERAATAEAHYEEVRQDLASHTLLNERELRHRDVFDAWLEAAIFGDFAGKNRRYLGLYEACGKPVEGIAVRITEAIAARILELDDVVAEVLEAVQESGTAG